MESTVHHKIKILNNTFIEQYSILLLVQELQLNATNENAQTLNNKLNSSIDQFNTKIEALKSTTNLLIQEQSIQLNSSIEQCRVKNAALSSKLNTTNENLHMLNLRLQNIIETQIIELGEQVNITRKAVKTLQFHLNATNQMLLLLRSEFSTFVEYSNSTVILLESQLNLTNQHFQILSIQLNASIEQYEAIFSSERNTTNKLKLLESRSNTRHLILQNGLDSSVEQCGEKFVRLESQLNASNEQTQTLQNDLDVLITQSSAQITDIQAQVNTSNEQNLLEHITFQTSISELENNSRILLQDIENLKDSVNHLSTFHPTRNPCTGKGATGEYSIETSSTSSINVFCDMDRANCTGCDVPGGWLRVAYLNMTDPNQNCPEEFNFYFQANPHLIRTCRRPNNLIGCASTIYATYGVEYSRVCGQYIYYCIYIIIIYSILLAINFIQLMLLGLITGIIH